MCSKLMNMPSRRDTGSFLMAIVCWWSELEYFGVPDPVNSSILIGFTRTLPVASQAHDLHHNRSGDPLSGALVRLRHPGLFLRRLGGVMGSEAGVWTALHQLCGGLAARLVFISSTGANVLRRCGGVAGPGQLLFCGFNCLLDYICSQRDCRMGMAA